MAAAFLTPKPTRDVHLLPPCPPTPRPLRHTGTTTLNAPAFPSTLGFPASLFDDGPSSDAENESASTEVPKALPAAKRRRTEDARPIPVINLKPRPSKYIPPPPRRRLSLARFTGKSVLQSRTADNSLTRTSSKTSLHAMARSPSYQMLVRAGRRPGLTRRPSFSRAA